MKKALAIVAILFSQVAYPSSPEELIGSLFSGLRANDAQKATDGFLSKNSHSTHNDSTRMKFEKHFGDLIDLAGRFHNGELLERKRIGKTVDARVYLLNHSKKPVQMTVVFYKQKNTWAVKHMHLNIDFAEDISDEIRKASIHK